MVLIKGAVKKEHIKTAQLQWQQNDIIFHSTVVLCSISSSDVGDYSSSLASLSHFLLSEPHWYASEHSCSFVIRGMNRQECPLPLLHSVFSVDHNVLLRSPCLSMICPWILSCPSLILSSIFLSVHALPSPGQYLIVCCMLYPWEHEICMKLHVSKACNFLSVVDRIDQSHQTNDLHHPHCDNTVMKRWLRSRKKPSCQLLMPSVH